MQCECRLHAADSRAAEALLTRLMTVDRLDESEAELRVAQNTMTHQLQMATKQPSCSEITLSCHVQKNKNNAGQYRRLKKL